MASAAKGNFHAAIIAFLDGSDLPALAPHTQSDMRKSIYHAKNGIDMKFGGPPSAASNGPRFPPRH